MILQANSSRQCNGPVKGEQREQSCRSWKGERRKSVSLGDIGESIQRICKDLLCVYHYTRCLDNIHVLSDRVPDLTGYYTFRTTNSKGLNAAKTCFRITMQPAYQESDYSPQTFFNTNFVFNAFENWFLRNCFPMKTLLNIHIRNWCVHQEVGHGFTYSSH